MRILICNWKDLAHPRAGGAEVWTHGVASAWVADGHDVTLACSAAPGLPVRDERDGVGILRGGSYRQGVHAHRATRVRTARGQVRPGRRRDQHAALRRAAVGERISSRCIHSSTGPRSVVPGDDAADRSRGSVRARAPLAARLLRRAGVHTVALDRRIASRLRNRPRDRAAPRF